MELRSGFMAEPLRIQKKEVEGLTSYLFVLGEKTYRKRNER